MTNDNWAIAGAGILLLVFLIWYLRRHLKKPTLPAPLELFDVGTNLLPVRAMMEEFNSRLVACKERSQLLKTRLQELEEQDLENLSPAEVLDGCNEDERSNLLAVLPVESLGDKGNQAIVDAIRKAGSHSIATGFRRLGSGEKYIPYIEATRDVARKIGAKVTKQMTQPELETKVIVTVFDTIVKSASPEDRAALLKSVQSEHGKTYVGPTVAASTLVLANLSGLGLYLASTANTIALATAFGIAVPTYAGVISILSVATGPVGWSALAVVLAYKVGGPNFKITVPAIMMIASVRARRIAERDAEIKRLKDQLSGEIAIEWSALETLRSKIQALVSEVSGRK